ncbi:hypothetical protein [Nereida sp. NH-UV-3]|uniref:hypothetical protein n=1 Tax=Nereida TaxID=282198 RepID=UPI0036F219B7
MKNRTMFALWLTTSLGAVTALPAYSAGHGAKVIGETTALIAEAGLPTQQL